MIIGSHDSCAYQSKDDCMCLCWLWAKTQSLPLHEQFHLGVRLFDLRYHLDSVFYISHTFSTSYTVEQALTDLIHSASDMNEYVYIRLKRDSSSVPLPSFGSALRSLIINGQPFDRYIVPYPSVVRGNPVDQRCIVLYSDDTTLHDDNVDPSWIFPQLFDAVETWDCPTVDAAVQRIHDMPFYNNGLPKAIFIDFSGKYPPEIVFDIIWKRVSTIIMPRIASGDITCIMINHVSAEIMQTLQGH